MKIEPVNFNAATYGVDIVGKSFYICEDIDEHTPRKVYLAASILSQIDDDRPIRMYLSTTGGDVEAGIAIYDFLKSIDQRLEIVVTGYAYSMGCIILQAADNRLIMPNASIMAHWGHQAIEDNNPVNFERKQMFQKTLDNVCDLILLEKLKKKKKSWTLKKVKSATQFDWYMTAAESVKIGLSDLILS